jgi:hypothetical protein
MGRYTALAILALVLLPLALSLLSVATAVVKAQTVTAVVLGAGKSVTLEATLTISPGDAIAPHLYTWYTNRVNSYVEVPASTSLTLSGDFTVCVFVAPTRVYSYWFGVVDNGRNYVANWWFLTRGGFSGFLAGIGFTDATVMEIRFPSEIVYTFHHYCFGVSGNTFFGYKNGSLYSSLSFSGIRNVASYPIDIGKRVGGTDYVDVLVGQVLVYSRASSSSEIKNIYTYNIVNASGLVLFLDPTFYNGTHYIDLSGYNNHGVGYNGVLRIIDSRTWLYLVKGRFSDGYVHFMFFPVNSVVYIYSSSGNLVTSFVIRGGANPAGLVQDYPVSLSAGTYKVVVYTYQDYTIYQNSGTTYTRLVARYAPGSSLRLMVNATSGIQAIRYQVATDPNFNNIAYDNTISTSNSYIDIALPSVNNTYYLRVAVQFTGGSRSPWSNTYQFRVDWLTAGIITTSNVFSTSSAPTILYNITYTDRSYPYAPATEFNTTVVALGKYNLTSYWWRVDVYKGATTSAEPPNPSYYTYLGTVCTVHPYFNSFGYRNSIPSTYTASYIFQGVADNNAPYWATAVGAPSTYFAFVYQSFVYLPLSGTYTIEVHSDDGVRVYTNGSLVIDKWSGATSTSTSVYLNAGWYNVTVKYWQGSDALRLYLGVVLPNGTAVRPLVPIKGIKMVAPPPPPGSSAKIVLPSVGTALVPAPTVVSSASGSIPIALLTAGAVNITLDGYDMAFGYSARASTVIRFGAVVSGYSTNFVNNKVTIFVVDGLGRPVDAGYINVSDSGSTIGFVNVSGGTATVSFNRFANGTLAIVDPGDNSIIFSNPNNGILLYKSALSNRVSAVATLASQIQSYRELPGLVYVRAELRGNASIVANTSLPTFLVKVNGKPSNFVAVSTAVGTNIILTNLGSTVEVVYANSTTAVTNIGAGPGGGVFLIGFADTYNLTSAVYMVGLLVNGSVAQPFAYINGSWRFGDSFYVSFPMVPMLSFGYEGVNLSVYWVLVQARGYATGYSKGYWISPVTTGYTRMYPFLMVLNQTAVAERFGVIPSAFASYLAKSSISISVLGPYPAGLLVTTIAVTQPIQIVYSGSDIRVVPSQTPGLSFVGFKGFRLSISVGNIQLQNIEVAQDPMTLYLPVGFTALLVVDTASKTISLTQMALPQPPGALTPVPTSIPVLAPPPTSVQLTEPASAIQYSILIAAFTAVALAIWRRTGDFGYGVALAGVAGAIIALVLGNATAVAVALMIMGIGIAVSIYERRA